MSNDFYCEEVLSGRTPVQVVQETDRVLAYHHTRPHWPVHIVVIPKMHVPSLTDLGDAGQPILTDLLEVVQAVAGSLPARWLIKESGSPVDHADALMNDAAVSDLADPWGAPMTIEFSAVATREDEQGTTEFCRVRSIGPDGEPGTDDDLLWVIYLDGTVAGKD